MSALDERARATALRLFAKYGQTVTITHRTPGAYNPETGAAAESTSVDVATGLEVAYELREIDGTRVLAGDRRFFISAVGIAVPTPGDTVTLGNGTVLRVVVPGAVSPSGRDILYAVQLRS